MGVWDDRYGNPGAPAYRGEPRNEPFDLVDGLRNVTTLKGVLPYASIDPRAVDCGQPVTVLTRGSYDGQVARFRHTDGQPPWLCMWDTALNSGAGAWAVVGGAPLTARQSSGASGSSAAINTWAALPNTPQLAVPAGGIYLVSAAGNLSSESSGAKQARVRIWDGSTGSRVIGSLLASGMGQSSSPGGAPVSLTVADGTTLSLQQCTDGTTVTFGAAADLWRMSVTPIELRP